MSEEQPPPGATTDFGRRRVRIEEKSRLVGEVFSSVAQKYDLMNDLMSFGSHRLLKRYLVEAAAIREDHRVLDLAAGSCDLSLLLTRKIGPQGALFIADINPDMLSVGRDRLINAGALGQAQFLIADAEALPLAENSLDRILMAFGFRNLTRKEQGLCAALRVLKPGGKLLVLEFSKPRLAPLGTAFSAFSSLWPLLGKAVAGNAESYQYLAESIERHPSQEAVSQMFQDSGFVDVSCHDLLGGITAIHTGIKPVAPGRSPQALGGHKL